MLAISAVSLSPTNPLEGLEIADRPEPVPHDDWVPIRMRATTLNHHDLWSLKGVGLRVDTRERTYVLESQASAVLQSKQAKKKP